jgi:hypothetical protein
MTGQRAVEPPVWGRRHKPFVKRLQNLWTLLSTEVLSTEEVFREDGTSARRAMVHGAIRS